MYENLDDFGTILAADGKAIQSFATKISKKQMEKPQNWSIVGMIKAVTAKDMDFIQIIMI